VSTPEPSTTPDAPHLDLAGLGAPAQLASGMSGEHAQLLAATLDAPWSPTMDLPLLWHWAFFNPVVRTADLGPDGHPRRENPMMVEFPRRMWVGGEVRSERPLRLDTPAVRRTRLLEHTRKHGSSGDLLIVSLEHVVEQGGAIALVERHDIIYRQAGGVTAPPGPPVELVPVDATSTGDPGWSSTVRPSTALLFRFSAITFNTHRIHYDLPYATDVEHYPALVVHGPLTAMLLAQSAAKHLGRPLRTFSYRASSPLFVDHPVRIDGISVDHGTTSSAARMTATRFDGAVAMTATAMADLSTAEADLAGQHT
jgi:3-methylfumaryl-CoA hydratase